MGVPQYDRRKFGWLDRMMFDITLSPTARLVGFALYRHLNDVSGDAWPSQETIRRKLGIGNIRTVRAAVRALYKAGYIEIIFDPVSRSNSYKPIYAAGDEGKSAPIDRGNIAPTIGALSPSSMGALLTNDEGQSAPQSNLINKPREETRRTAARRPNGITEALNQIIERFEKKDRGADPEGHRCALIATKLKEQIGQDQFVSWFNTTRIADITADEIVVEVPSLFARKQIEERFGNALVRAARAAEPDSTVTRARIVLAGVVDLKSVAQGGLPNFSEVPRADR
jgi:hypothetical protein